MKVTWFRHALTVLAIKYARERFYLHAQGSSSRRIYEGSRKRMPALPPLFPCLSK